MKNLLVKTVGASENLENEVEFSSKVIADAIQFNISGGTATDLQADQLSQKFINSFNIKAKYASGTFLSFVISDEAEDEFTTFKKY